MQRIANRQRKAVTVTLPAPTLGLNSRDAWADMDPRYAVSMVNMFPTTNSVRLRKGYELADTVQFVSGGVNPMEAFGRFIKYGDANLFTTAQRFNSPAVALVEDVVSGTQTTSFTAGSGYAQMANGSGTYVVVAGGEYWTFDGTNWTDNTASLVASTSHVATFRNRLWFARSGLLSAWYLPTLAITGTLVEFPLGGVAKKGGVLRYVGTWTLDGGDGGLDDRIVFITSNGEVIVYEGTDPGTAATFALVGVFDVSKPIAPPIKYGSDLLLVCSDGLYSMTEIIRGNVGHEFAVSSLIRGDWQAAAAGASFSITNVSACYSAKLNCIAVNFPTSAFVVLGRQTSDWFVMNTITKAWTKFTGLDAYFIEEFQGDIYFCNVASGGSSSSVWKWGSVGADNGSAITGYCRQAYSNLGESGTLKQITGIMPAFTVTGSHTVGCAIEHDYRNELTTSSTPTNEQTYATGSYRPMLSYPVMGETLAPFFEASSSVSALDWFSTTLLAIPGGVV